VVTAYQELLAQCGFELAGPSLARLFELEGVDDPRVQYAIALDITERTVLALQTLTRTKTLH
jgi:hypothetical protein